MPAFATTVAPPPTADEWLQLEPEALELAALEQAAISSDAAALNARREPAAATLDARGESSSAPRLVPTLALVDQVGAVSISALRSSSVTLRTKTLAGGPGSNGKGPSARRQQQNR